MLSLKHIAQFIFNDLFASHIFFELDASSDSVFEFRFNFESHHCPKLRTEKSGNSSSPNWTAFSGQSTITFQSKVVTDEWVMGGNGGWTILQDRGAGVRVETLDI